ncbi:MAG: OmpA family protein [Paludibacteraceae bacterium]|nr:OmpA family protein [Paludibacteraceae bacterium]
MKRTIVFLCILLASCAVFAKKKEVNNLDKNSEKSYKGYIHKGDEQFKKIAPAEKHQALSYYLKAYMIDSTSASLNYKIGEAYLYSPTEKATCLRYFQQSVAANPSSENANAWLRLANAYQLNLQFDSAIVWYEKYRKYKVGTPMTRRERRAVNKKFDKKIKECNAGLAHMVKPREVFIDNFDRVNSANEEYNTTLSPDWSTLAYTKAIYVKSKKRVESAQSVFKDPDGNWSTPDPLFDGEDRGNYSIVDMGNNDLFLFDGSKPNKIIHFVYKKDTWKKDRAFKWNKRRFVKKITFSSDSSKVYFSTYAKADWGKVSYDIFVATQKRKHNSKGTKWNKAIPLPGYVNSEYDEICPELHNDTTMYFASNGHNTMGGYDIFRSRYKNGIWGRPENLGYPINTPFDDTFYTITSRDNKAFISSNRDGGMGYNDIYMLTYVLPKDLALNFEPPISLLGDGLLGGFNTAKAAEMDSSFITLLKGVIMNEDSIPLRAQIELADNGLQQVIATFESDSIGSYRVKLPGGVNYGVSVSAPGYLFHSENFNLPEQTEYREIEKNIILKRIAIGKNVIMKNIFFETAKADLSAESQIELNNLIKLLQDNPTLCLEIGGHTDNKGSRAYNTKLSQARAQSVVDYLVSHGIDASRLTSKGYAFDRPIADNKTEAGRQENRRTEFLVTQF